MMEKQTKIGTVCSDFDTFQLKSVLVKNDAGDWGNELDKDAIGVIRSTNFNNDGRLDLSDIAYRTLSKRKFEEKKLYASDILIERSGGSETQPVGRVGFITDEIAETDYAFANFIQRISLNDNVNAKFVYYCLQQMYEMGITAGMQSQTTGIRNLDWKQYIKVLLPKPSISEQTAIAAILSKVDEAIASVQASIAAAERLKKSLMQNLLTGRMKPDGTLRKEDEFYVDEKFGRVPLGWEVKRIDEISERKTEVIDPTKTKEIYDYIGLEHILPDEFVRCGKGLSNETVALKVKFETGDLLYGKLRPYLNKVFISDISGVGSTEFIVLKQNEFTNWVYLNFQLKKFLDYTKSMTAGTQHPRASWKDIKHYLVSIPKNEQERKQITKELLSLEQRKKTNNDKIAVLERLKKSLMQNLLTGRVRVK
ncbi:MAG: restriction endonuclease subunit S [bacterium]|nr:restriction endonuclease subunit S [bacterium]